MAKLFVAIALPESTAAELVAIQPKKVDGVRLMDPDQMHVTLHFIGEVAGDRSDKISIALASVKSPTFQMTIQGVGQFPSAGGTTTLWAGIGDCPELLELHNAVGRALAREGFQLESRKYTAHVSIARCAKELPESIVSEFLTHHRNLLIYGVAITCFGLYSSVIRDQVPSYRCERVYPLRIPGLPLIDCKHAASPREEITPARMAEILLDQEARWHHADDR